VLGVYVDRRAIGKESVGRMGKSRSEGVSGRDEAMLPVREGRAYRSTLLRERGGYRRDG
jgi:hypothetical protein